MKKIDLKGKRFGRLLVVEEVERSKCKRVSWECLCDCGNVVPVIGTDLKNGNTQSCGCLQRERTSKANKKHGMSYTPTYETWSRMIYRCYNSNDPDYKNWGGRGIKVCDEWLNFQGFFANMGLKPKGLTIERRNNELGYYKENCYWASRTIQVRNQRLKKSNTSGCNGVNLIKHTQKWQVRITVNYKRYFIGNFAILKEAINARKRAERKYWRE